MVLASNPHATSNQENSVRATRARTEVSAKKAGIDSFATALALATGHAPVREVSAFFSSTNHIAYYLQGRGDNVYNSRHTGQLEQHGRDKTVIAMIVKVLWFHKTYKEMWVW